MIAEGFSDEELALYIWRAASVHAVQIHRGGADQTCPTCTQFYDAIAEIEASALAEQGRDGQPA